MNCVTHHEACECREAAKALEIRLLHTAIDKSNEALEEAIKTKEERDRLLLQVDEMRELLRQANDLYTGYGLICGPIKDFPKYEGTVHQGEWIGKIRAILRASEKPKCECPTFPHRPGCDQIGVFCLDHRKMMVEGVCPKCAAEDAQKRVGP